MSGIDVGKARKQRPDGTYVIRFIPGRNHTESRRSPRVMPRASFQQLVSQPSGDLLGHVLPSVERDRVTGALAMQLSIDLSWVKTPMISLPSQTKLLSTRQ